MMKDAEKYLKLLSKSLFWHFDLSFFLETSFVIHGYH